MSQATKTPPPENKAADPPDPTAQILAELGEIRKAVGEHASKIEELQKPIYKEGRTPQRLFGGSPHVTTGPLGERGFSYLKAAAYVKGWVQADEAKEEVQLCTRLRDVYRKFGFVATQGASLLVPYATANMPRLDQESEALVTEVQQKLAAGARGYDPDEAQWLATKMSGPDRGYWQKVLSVANDQAGGVLVGFPTLGELIDLQRNMEAFTKAGTSEAALPPNGRIQYPKLTNAATANWIGEATAIPESTAATGYLDLVAKKLGIFSKLNNELLKFNTLSAEGMVRTDMARVAALFMDLACFTGTGGTQILGLLNYPTTTAWTTGVDKLIVHTAGTTGANGDTFEPEDVATMEAKLPDMVEAPTAWVMRKNFFDKIMNRRADAATAGDKKGPFMFWTSRGTVADKPPLELWGTKVVRSSQVSNTRVKGSGTNLTFVLLGYFPDWIIARAGVLEFLATNLGDTAFQNDQTWLRAIQHVDAGARHAASFVLCDQLLVA